MHDPLRIAIADPDPQARAAIENALKQLGHRVCASVDSAAALHEECLACPPDAIIADTSVGPAFAIVSRFCGQSIPVVLTAIHASELVRQAADRSVVG